MYSANWMIKTVNTHVIPFAGFWLWFASIYKMYIVHAEELECRLWMINPSSSVQFISVLKFVEKCLPSRANVTPYACIFDP